MKQKGCLYLTGYTNDHYNGEVFFQTIANERYILCGQKMEAQ